MKRKDEHKDWTGALKESLQDFGVAPSAGAWKRLEAAGAGAAGAGNEEASRRGPVLWWPWAAGLAAAGVALVLFLTVPGIGPDANRTPENAVAEILPASPSLETPSVDSVGSGWKSNPEPDNSVPETVPSKRPVEKTPSEPVSIEEPLAVETTPGPSEEKTDAAEADGDGDVSSVSAPVEDSASRDNGAGQEQVSDKAGKDWKQPLSDPFAEPVRTARPAKRKSVRGRPSIGISVGSGLLAAATSASAAGATGAGGPKKSARRYDIGEILEHQAPSTVGAQLFVPLTGRLQLETGLITTSLHSSFKSISQELRFTGLPLRLGYKVLDWGFGDINVSAGGMMEGCTKARLMDQDYKESAQYSACAAAIARCKLFGPVRIYASPELSYYFTRTTLPTCRTRQPLAFSVCGGLSIDF